MVQFAFSMQFFCRNLKTLFRGLDMFLPQGLQLCVYLKAQKMHITQMHKIILLSMCKHAHIPTRAHTRTLTHTHTHIDIHAFTQVLTRTFKV